MTYSGHVKNGMVVLDERVRLPEGAGGGRRARRTRG
jgi:hypothetical protein